MQVSRGPPLCASFPVACSFSVLPALDNPCASGDRLTKSLKVVGFAARITRLILSLLVWNISETSSS